MENEMKSGSNVCMDCNSCGGGCGSSMGWTDNCSGHCGNGRGHYTLRWILGLIILGSMFCLGAMFGMLSAEVHQNRGYFMTRYNGDNMMYQQDIMEDSILEQ